MAVAGVALAVLALAAPADSQSGDPPPDDPQSCPSHDETVVIVDGRAYRWAETEARRPDGTLLFADVIRLCPVEGGGPRSLALLGGRDVLATLYVVTQRRPADEIVQLVREAPSVEGVLVGVSELPNGCGVSARFLGPTSKAVRAALTNAWNAARLTLLGAPAPDLRKR